MMRPYANKYRKARTVPAHDHAVAYRSQAGASTRQTALSCQESNRLRIGQRHISARG
jgi:hypothetical protein